MVRGQLEVREVELRSQPLVGAGFAVKIDIDVIPVG